MKPPAQPSTSSPLLYIATGALGTVLLLLSLLLAAPMGRVVTITLSALSLNLFFWRGILQLQAPTLTFKLFLSFCWLQPLAFLLLCVAFPANVMQFCDPLPIFKAWPGSLLATFTLPFLAGFLFACADRACASTTTVDTWQRLRATLNHPSASADALLVLGAVVTLTIWWSTTSGSLVAYYLRVLHRAMFFCPFLAGLYWSQSRPVRILWLAVLTVGLFLAMFTGSRTYGFWPVVLYGVGFLLQLPNLRARLRLLVVGVVLSPLGLFIFGLSQNIRTEFGRADARDLEMKQILVELPELIVRGVERTASVDDSGDDALYTSLGRIVDWMMVFVPAMTPEQVPYRGYGDFHREVRSQLAVYSLMGPDSEAGYYDTRGLARDYGFLVYTGEVAEGRSTSSTVPVNIFADSWSRGGALSSIVQLMVAFGFLALGERLGARFFRSRDFYLVHVAALSGSVISCLIVYTLAESVRQILLCYPFFFMSYVFSTASWRFIRK